MRATERLERADDEVDQRLLFRFADDLEQVDRRILIEPQNGIVDQRKRSATIRADSYGIALAERRSERGRLPIRRLGTLHFDLPFDGCQFADHRRAWLRGLGARNRHKCDRAAQKQDP